MFLHHHCLISPSTIIHINKNAHTRTQGARKTASLHHHYLSLFLIVLRCLWDVVYWGSKASCYMCCCWRCPTHTTHTTRQMAVVFLVGRIFFGWAERLRYVREVICMRCMYVCVFRLCVFFIVRCVSFGGC